MKLALIAAIGKNRVIGRGGKLPWHISDDLKRFKRLTTGHTVLMGRKTFESLGKPLANRRNVVISSRQIPEVETYASIDAALHALNDEELVFAIGGAQIYSAILEKADELYLTFVDAEISGDVYFPRYDDLVKRDFREVHREKHDGFEFVDYVREQKDRRA